jgi:chemotaxis protein methyltransferase CheR
MEGAREREPARFAALAAADPRVLALVIAEITSGETCFFREPAQLDWLRRAVLPRFEARRRAGQPPRLWSAGCATGEEAYSLAILVREAGWADRAMVLGTDVARPRLEAARRARYGRWSLRAVPEEMVARWFTRRGAHFRVVPRIRDAVTFRDHNLAAGDWPGGDSGIADMDVVLCRHVLVYLDPPTMLAVAERLLRTLAPEGWLLVGASDPALHELVSCEVVTTGAGVAYRRAAERASGASATFHPTLPAATTPSGGPAA